MQGVAIAVSAVKMALWAVVKLEDPHPKPLSQVGRGALKTPVFSCSPSPLVITKGTGGWGKMMGQLAL